MADLALIGRVIEAEKAATERGDLTLLAQEVRNGNKELFRSPQAREMIARRVLGKSILRPGKHRPKRERDSAIVVHIWNLVGLGSRPYATAKSRDRGKCACSQAGSRHGLSADHVYREILLPWLKAHDTGRKDERQRKLYRCPLTVTLAKQDGEQGIAYY